jgi:hypothetical protein
VDTWKEMGNLLRGQLYADRGGGVEDTVFLAGQGRSGTTWISEIVNAEGDYRFIDEPFHPGRLSITRAFRPRQYLRPEDRSPAHLQAAERILGGGIRSVWTDRYNRRVFPRKRLIKEVRGNLLLPWIRRNFPQMPMVLLLRHPCAVVTSQFRLAEDWHVDLARFLSQEQLMADHLEPVRAEIEVAAESGSEFERHVFAWAIDHVVPLREFRPGDVHLAFYESFCVDPAGETERLFAGLGRPVEPAALRRSRRPSATAQKDSAILSGGAAPDLVNRWKQDVTVQQLERVVEILRLFGLDHVYGEDGMPLVASPEDALITTWRPATGAPAPRPDP